MSAKRRYPEVISDAERAKRYTYDHDATRLEAAWELSWEWWPFWNYWVNTPDEQWLKSSLFPISEAWCDVISSLISAAHALYRSALSSLRSAMELSLTAIYFDVTGSEAIDYYDQTGKTPTWATLIKEVLNQPCYQQYADFMHARQATRLAQWTDRDRLNALYYGVLSKATHGYVTTWNLSTWHDVAPLYDPGAFGEWHDLFTQVNTRCLLLLYLHFEGVAIDVLQHWLHPFEGLFTPLQAAYLTRRAEESRTGA